MAKNIKTNFIKKVQRKLQEAHTPYIAENKLDHAMLELKKARIELFKYKIYLGISILIGVTLWMK